MAKPILYLASQSSRRREILTRMGVRFKVIPSTYHEAKLKNCSPEALVLRHALGKAEKAKAPRFARYILGADTIVSYRHHVLGKPKNRAAAKRMLRLLSGKKHEVLTGVVLRDIKTRRVYQDFEVTEVYFKRLSPGQIDAYFNEVNPLDKAGSYAIQEGPKIVRKIKGSYSNVVGLPEELLKNLLSKIRNSNSEALNKPKI